MTASEVAFLRQCGLREFLARVSDCGRSVQRLYGSVAKEAEQRLQAKTQQRDHSQSASAAKGASFEGQAPVVPVSQAASAESSPQ